MVELVLLTNPLALLTASCTEAVAPTGTAKVARVVEARVKHSVVAVTVRLTEAVCDAPPVPLAVPVTVMPFEPNTMFGRVVIVRVTV